MRNVLSVFAVVVIFGMVAVIAGCSSNNNVVSEEAKVLLGVSEFTDVTGNTATPVCGNGIRETGERCDDGNTVTGDGCSRDCKYKCVNDTYRREQGLDYYVKGSAYGFNNVSTIIMTAPDFCFSATVLKDRFCGANDKIQIATFTCPDGCTNGACTPVLPVCGNGMKEGTEQCDDGNALNGDSCDNQCKLEVCGNGVVQTGEMCDDNNTVSGDGCRADCKSFCVDTDPLDDVLVAGTVEWKNVSEYTNITNDLCSGNYLSQSACTEDDRITSSRIYCSVNQCAGSICIGTCTPGATTIRCVNRYQGYYYTENVTCRADGHSYDRGDYYTIGDPCPEGTACVDGVCS